MPRTRKSLAEHLAPFRGPQALACKGAPGFSPEGKTWIVERLLRRGEITLLVGKPKDGKTCLAATLATAVARGTDFAGLETQRTNVLYLAAEESPDEWSLGPEPYLTQVDPRRLAIVLAPLAIDRQAHLDILRKAIEARDIGLLVVDPLLAALDNTNLQGFPAARSALLRLRTLCRETNLAALVLHHSHERDDRAVSAAGHPVLSAIAHRTFILNHDPHLNGRIATLRSRKDTLRLVSQNPGHYAPNVNHTTLEIGQTPQQNRSKVKRKIKSQVHSKEFLVSNV